MPMLRRSLRWVAIAILAVFAPFLALAVYAAEKVRTRKRQAGIVEHRFGQTVVAFPRSTGRRRAGAVRPDGGAVILPFPRPAVVADQLLDPPALTGSL